MYNETMMTIVGNLTAEPRLRTLESGVKVVNFRVASTPRRFDREAGRYIDLDGLFLNVSCWRDLAENVVTSLHKGDPVVAIGRLHTREFLKNEQPQQVIEMDAVAVGPDLAKGVAPFRRIRSALAARGATAEPNAVDAESRGIDTEAEPELASSAV